MNNEFDEKREQVEAELESLIRAEIEPSQLVQVLKDGLQAMKVVYKVSCEDYSVRLAYFEAVVKYGRMFDAKGKMGAGLSDPRLQEALKTLLPQPKKENIQ